MNLGKLVDIEVGLVYASGTADRNGAEVDMSGWDGVLMIFSFAAIAAGAVVSVKAQQDIVTGMATAADLLGTGQVVADDDDDKVFTIDLYKPLERFVRGVVDNDASNASAQSLLYIKYRGAKAPVDNSGIGGYELHVSPIEGTA